MVLTTTLLATVAGVTLGAAVYHLPLGLRKEGGALHLWFALVAAAYGLYDLTTIGLYAATTPEAYGLWLKLHLGANLWATAGMFWFVAEYTGIRQPKVLWGASALLAVFFGLTLLSPHGLYFVRVESLSEVVLPWGEAVANPSGAIHPLRSLMAPVGAVALLYWIGCAWRQYRRGDGRRALVLGTALGIYLGVVVFAAVIDRNPMPAMPVDEIGFIAMVVVMSLGLSGEVLAGRRSGALLEESEARLRAIVDSAPEAIVLVDVERGAFTHSNLQARRLFRASEEEIQRASPGTFSPEVQPNGSDSRETARALLMRAAGGESVVTPWSIRDTEGRLIPCEMRMHGLPDRDRMLVRVSLIDLTERVEAEARAEELEQSLRQAQKLETVGTLAGGIAHDFNNLLLPVMAYADVALSELEEGHPIRKDLEGILESAERARELVLQLLAFSRMDDAEMRPVSLHRAVSQAFNLLRATAPASVTIDFDAPETDHYLVGDATQLQQVVMNLGTNALHAMPSGGSLTIRLRPAGDEVPPRELDPDHEWMALEVADTGEGIPEDVRDRIFDPFFTTKEVGRGTGLGLSVVHGIVARHQGAIRVESSAGEGTVFTILLPLCEGPGDPVEPEVVESGLLHGAGRRILVLDDQPAVTAATARLLEGLGFVTESFNTPKEALQRIATTPPFDCALVDFDMPGVNGEEWVRRAHAVVPDLSIVIMTGATRTTAATARASGAKGLVLKPFTGPSLARAIREYCDD